MMKNTFHIVTAALILAVASAAAQERKPDEYPAKPVRIIVPSAPGGGIDIIGRIAAQKLAEAWGQQVIVDNRPGASNTLGSSIAAKAPPDGYTLLAQSLSITYAGELRKLSYDASRDFHPVVLVATQPSLLAVHVSVPVKTVREFLQLARSRPGQLHYGSSGPGGASHMATELLASTAKIKLNPVQYKGIGPAMTAMLSGEVDLGVLGISTMLPHVTSGRIRALGVTGAKRSTQLPNVPTIAEAGVPGYEFEAWYALFAPAKTPRAITSKINADMNRTLQQPETRQKLAGGGLEALGGTEEAFAKYFQAEVVRWAKVVKDAKISGE
ncbi:MAG: tripartite tricarboxylate transporter substrate binding protein [Burkholderiales bacterium]